MKYCLLQVGKTRERALNELFSIYEKRLNHYTRFEVISIPAYKGRGVVESIAKREEGQRLIAKLRDSDRVVVLDDKGCSFTSVELSKCIHAQLHQDLQRVVFAIGGAYGFSQEVYSRADERWSLSKLTFPHQMVRLFFVEQLYRAFTILHREPYHHK